MHANSARAVSFGGFRPTAAIPDVFEPRGAGAGAAASCDMLERECKDTRETDTLQ
jgi:hypothetical protein